MMTAISFCSRVRTSVTANILLLSSFILSTIACDLDANSLCFPCSPSYYENLNVNGLVAPCLKKSEYARRIVLVTPNSILCTNTTCSSSFFSEVYSDLNSALLQESILASKYLFSNITIFLLTDDNKPLNLMKNDAIQADEGEYFRWSNCSLVVMPLWCKEYNILGCIEDDRRISIFLNNFLQKFFVAREMLIKGIIFDASKAILNYCCCFDSYNSTANYSLEACASSNNIKNLDFLENYAFFNIENRIDDDDYFSPSVLQLINCSFLNFLTVNADKNATLSLIELSPFGSKLIIKGLNVENSFFLKGLIFYRQSYDKLRKYYRNENVQRAIMKRNDLFMSGIDPPYISVANMRVVNYSNNYMEGLEYQISLVDMEDWMGSIVFNKFYVNDSFLFSAKNSIFSLKNLLTQVEICELGMSFSNAQILLLSNVNILLKSSDIHSCSLKNQRPIDDDGTAKSIFLSDKGSVITIQGTSFAYIDLDPSYYNFILLDTTLLIEDSNFLFINEFGLRQLRGRLVFSNSSITNSYVSTYYFWIEACEFLFSSFYFGDSSSKDEYFYFKDNKGSFQNSSLERLRGNRLFLLNNVINLTFAYTEFIAFKNFDNLFDPNNIYKSMLFIGFTFDQQNIDQVSSPLFLRSLIVGIQSLFILDSNFINIIDPETKIINRRALIHVAYLTFMLVNVTFENLEFTANTRIFLIACEQNSIFLLYNSRIKDVGWRGKISFISAFDTRIYFLLVVFWRAVLVSVIDLDILIDGTRYSLPSGCFSSYFIDGTLKIQNSSFLISGRNDNSEHHALIINQAQEVLLSNLVFVNFTTTKTWPDFNHLHAVISFFGDASYSYVPNFNLAIENISLSDCSGGRGGGLAIVNYKNVILKNIIFNRISAVANGGAMVFMSCKNILVVKSSIFSTQAAKGGAISVEKADTFFILDLNASKILASNEGAIRAISVVYLSLNTFFIINSKNYLDGGVFYFEKARADIIKGSLKDIYADQGGFTYATYESNISVKYITVSNINVHRGGFFFVEEVNSMSLTSIDLTDCKAEDVNSVLLVKNIVFEIVLLNINLNRCYSDALGSIFIQVDSEITNIQLINIFFVENFALSSACLYIKSNSDIFIENVTITRSAHNLIYFNQVKAIFISFIQISDSFSNKDNLVTIIGANGEVSFENISLLSNRLGKNGIYVEDAPLVLSYVVLLNNTATLTNLHSLFAVLTFRGSSSLYLNHCSVNESRINFALIMLIDYDASFGVNVSSIYIRGYKLSTFSDETFALIKVTRGFLNISHGKLFDNLANLIYFEGSRFCSFSLDIDIPEKFTNLYFLIADQNDQEREVNITRSIFRKKNGSIIILKGTAKFISDNSSYFCSNATYCENLDSTIEPSITFKGVRNVVLTSSIFGVGLKSAYIFHSTENKEKSIILIENSSFVCKGTPKKPLFIFLGKVDFILKKSHFDFQIESDLGISSDAVILGISSCFPEKDCQVIFEKNYFRLETNTQYIKLFRSSTTFITENSNQIDWSEGSTAKDSDIWEGTSFSKMVSSYPFYLITENNFESNTNEKAKLNVSTINVLDDERLSYTLFEDGNRLIKQKIKSGEYLNVKLIMADKHGTKQSYDSSSRLKITSTSLFIIQIEGIGLVAENGVFSLEKVRVRGVPNTSSNLTLEVELIDSASAFLSEVSVIRFFQYIELEIEPCIVGQLLLPDFTCQTCPSGTFSLSDPLKAKQCERCLENFECRGGDQLYPLPGYWRVSRLSRSAVKCIVKASCIGSRQSNMSEDEIEHGSCELGHQGNLCSECKKGFGKAKFLSLCRECKEQTKAILTKMVIIILLIVALVLLKAFKFSKPESLNSLKSLDLVIFKILFSHIQVISIITFMEDVSSVANLADIISVQSYLSFINDDFISFDCLLEEARYSNIYKSIGVVLLPLLIASLSLIIWLVIGLCFFIKMKFKDFEGNLPFEVSGPQIILRRFLISFAIGAYLLYPMILQSAFSLPNCVDFKDESQGIKFYLYLNPNIECWKDVHSNLMLFVFLPSVFLWGLCFPILLLKIFRIGRSVQNPSKKILINQLLRKKVSKIGKLFAALEMKIFRFFYEDYEDDHYYWEIVIFFKKLILTGLSGTRNLIGSELKLILTHLVLVIYLALMQKSKPFLQAKYNLFESISGILTISFLVFLAFLNSNSDFEIKLLLGYLVFGGNLIFVIVLLFEAVRYFLISFKSINFIISLLQNCVMKLRGKNIQLFKIRSKLKFEK